MIFVTVLSENGRKRPINSSTAKPCPKRFKRPLVPLAPVNEYNEVEKLPERQQSSSEPIAKIGFMIDSTSESSQSLEKQTSAILSSQGSPDKHTTTATIRTKNLKEPLVPVRIAAAIVKS